MKRHPIHSLSLRGAGRAIARAGHAAAALPLFGLSLATPTALAQSPNPWMNPNLVVMVARQDLPVSAFAQWGATQVDRLGLRPIYLLNPANGNAKALIQTLSSATYTVPGGPTLPPFAVHLGLNRQVASPETASLQESKFGAIKNSVNAIGDGEAKLAKLPVNWTDPWLQAGKLWLQSRGRGITVAVLDTGIDNMHPWFTGRLTINPLQQSDMVGRDNLPIEQRASRLDAGKAWGHGTHVAGTIAQVAPDAKILPVRVLDANGFGTLWTVARGTVYALDPDVNPKTADGARVLNMSFGASGLLDGESGMLKTVMKLATCHPELASQILPFNHAGFAADRERCSSKTRPIVVAGEGNTGYGFPLAPAQYSSSMRSLLAVTASDPRGFRAGWATKTAVDEIVAPGEWITSAYPTGDPRGSFAIMSGTSMAAPWVSGVSALLMSRYGASFSADSIRSLIRTTGAPVCGSLGFELAPLRAMTSDVSVTSACR